MENVGLVLVIVFFVTVIVVAILMTISSLREFFSRQRWDKKHAALNNTWSAINLIWGAGKDRVGQVNKTWQEIVNKNVPSQESAGVYKAYCDFDALHKACVARMAQLETRHNMVSYPTDLDPLLLEANRLYVSFHTSRLLAQRVVSEGQQLVLMGTQIPTDLKHLVERLERLTVLVPVAAQAYSALEAEHPSELPYFTGNVEEATRLLQEAGKLKTEAASFFTHKGRWTIAQETLKDAEVLAERAEKLLNTVLDPMDIYLSVEHATSILRNRLQAIFTQGPSPQWSQLSLEVYKEARKDYVDNTLLVDPLERILKLINSTDKLAQLDLPKDARKTGWQNEVTTAVAYAVELRLWRVEKFTTGREEFLAPGVTETINQGKKYLVSSLLQKSNKRRREHLHQADLSLDVAYNMAQRSFAPYKTTWGVQLNSAPAP